ncbi:MULTISPECIES: hypothetical protein [Pseudomonas]|uniref:Uncharacterized protein n=1 Tax=Pseudomonas tehranensis TaxID=2745502 RepID=A0ABR6UKV2_9PSED|nr:MULTISPECIES: hypothetical protein [Pseudomonas]MBC3345072.1 hypothetical protein [Pseudomonas tehranensis]SFG88354.1 hypothetical protein SAMN03159297_01812 [Pseudomonas sp. NFACC45]
MNNNDDDDLEKTSHNPSTDTSGVQVESDVEDGPTPAQTEEEAEELRRKIAEIERKVADGH